MWEKDYGYEYQIKAKRFNQFEISVRKMRKDEMPEDGEVYYCDTDGAIYKAGEKDFEIIN